MTQPQYAVSLRSAVKMSCSNRRCCSVAVIADGCHDVLRKSALPTHLCQVLSSAQGYVSPLLQRTQDVLRVKGDKVVEQCSPRTAVWCIPQSPLGVNFSNCSGGVPLIMIEEMSSMPRRM